MTNLRIALLSLCLITSGCSTLAPMAGKALLGASDKGIEVDANAGQAKTEGDSSVAQQANTAVSGQVNSEETTNYEGPVDTIVNDAGFKWWELGLIVLLAGWAIPSPGEMLERTVAIFRRPSRRRRFGPEWD